MKKEMSEKKDYITREIIEESIGIHKMQLEENVYVIQLEDKYLIAKRVGKCDYKKCKNACCKFCGLPYPHEYFEGFGDYSKKSNSIILKKNCKFLNKNGTCKKWGEQEGKIYYSHKELGRQKGFPRACSQFPYLDDAVFHQVMDICSFKYEIIYTIPNVSKRVMEEMLLNIKKQD